MKKKAVQQMTPRSKKLKLPSPPNLAPSICCYSIEEIVATRNSNVALSSISRTCIPIFARKSQCLATRISTSAHGLSWLRSIRGRRARHDLCFCWTT